MDIECPLEIYTYIICSFKFSIILITIDQYRCEIKS